MSQQVKPLPTSGTPIRRLRADGARSRAVILRQAAELATVDGLEGLSIGGLAAAIGMSKSGVYAHFGSKVDLQLATIEEADRIFHETVIEPALREPTALRRLRSLCDNYLNHLRDRVFPGGCFFAGAVLEMGTRPGPVRERVSRFQRELSGLIVQLVCDAQQEGALSEEHPPSLAFEINGQFLAASAAFVLNDAESTVLELARTILHHRISPELT